MGFRVCTRCNYEHNPFSSCVVTTKERAVTPSVKVVAASKPIASKLLETKLVTNRVIAWKRANRERYNKYMREWRARKLLQNKTGCAVPTP